MTDSIFCNRLNQLLFDLILTYYIPKQHEAKIGKNTECMSCYYFLIAACNSSLRGFTPDLKCAT